MEIKIFEKTGEFAENKDVARDIRLKEIMPALKKDQKVILNFSGVNSATQSFVHALISEVIRKETIEVLDRIEFKNCNDTIKNIIGIVTDYMQKPV
jgi:hypothetical protein